MATKESTKNVSVLRNRDYSKDFKWNPSLNKDVYDFYLKARETPQRGYMKRLKTLWDSKYPTYSHLSEKHLREHACFIHSKQNTINQLVKQHDTSTEENPHTDEIIDNIIT